MAQDKKVNRGQMVFILAQDIGAGFIAKNISLESLKMFLTNQLNEL